MSAKIRVGRVGTLSSLTEEQSGQQDTTVSENGTGWLEHAGEALRGRAELENLVEQSESLA
jgi:hypothetical protein